MLIILACGSPETGLSETLLRMKHRLHEQRAQRNMRKDYDEYKSLISHPTKQRTFLSVHNL